MAVIICTDNHDKGVELNTLADWFTDLATHQQYLNDWQSQFVHDLHNRFNRYGAGFRITEKQLGKLKEIYDHVLGGIEPEAAAQASRGRVDTVLKRYNHEDRRVPRKSRQSY